MGASVAQRRGAQQIAVARPAFDVALVVDVPAKQIACVFKRDWVGRDNTACLNPDECLWRSGLSRLPVFEDDPRQFIAFRHREGEVIALASSRGAVALLARNDDRFASRQRAKVSWCRTIVREITGNDWRPIDAINRAIVRRDGGCHARRTAACHGDAGHCDCEALIKLWQGVI